jgi:hypothetical protein
MFDKQVASFGLSTQLPHTRCIIADCVFSTSLEYDMRYDSAHYTQVT